MSSEIRILIIDDSAMRSAKASETIRRSIRSTILTALSAASGLQMAQQFQPTVTLLASNFVESHGLAYVAALRDHSGSAVLVMDDDYVDAAAAAV